MKPTSKAEHEKKRPMEKCQNTEKTLISWMRRKTSDDEDSLAAHSDSQDDAVIMQTEIAELKAKGKLQEKMIATQKSKIQELEEEKRDLQTKLCKGISKF